MAVAIDSASNRISSPSLGLSSSSILDGVDAAALSCLPPIWQAIAANEAEVKHDDPDFLIALARLFFTKGTDSSSEIYQQESSQTSGFQSFCPSGSSGHVILRSGKRSAARH